MLHHGAQLVRGVSDAAVVRDGDPPVPANSFEPHFVATVLREMIAVSFYHQTGFTKDLGELLSEITIREEDTAHAARSYTTACSTSCSVMP